MRVNVATLFLVLILATSAVGQSGPAPDVRFAGCYEVRSLVWDPPDESITLVPSRFELSTDPSPAGRHSFVIKTVDSGAPRFSLWGSNSKKSFWLSFGTGKQAFVGKLKQSDSGDFIGKLKYFCDWIGHCGHHVGTIGISKIDCKKVEPEAVSTDMAPSTLNQDLQTRLRFLTGEKALACGDVGVKMSTELANECAGKAFKAGKPFYVSYHVQGIDSAVFFALAMDSQRTLYFVESDSMGFVPPFRPGTLVESGKHILVEPCPRPYVLNLDRSQRLTCFAPPDLSKPLHN